MDVAASQAEHRAQRLAHGVAASLLPPPEAPLPSPTNGTLRVMQWNVLADGLASDGFLVQDVLEATSEMDATPSGRAEALLATADELARTRSQKDEVKLRVLQQQLADKRQQRNLDAIVSWKCRWPLIHAKIAAASPHIICLQELDHLADAIRDLGALGYVCAPPGQHTYEPCHTNRSIVPRTAADYDPAAFLTHLARVGMAFAPKVPSTARTLALKEGRDDADDDGVAIFWDASRFRAESIEFLSQFTSKRSHGAVRVVLRRTGWRGWLSPVPCVAVVSAHLPSGHKAKDVAARAEVLTGASYTTQSTGPDDRRGPSLCEWFLQAAARWPTLLVMDSNAAPNKPSGLPMWRAVLDSCAAHGGARSVWEDHFDPDGTPRAHVPPPATVNKMRGPLSGQPDKVGEHELAVIDHIFLAPADAFGAFRHALPPCSYPDAAAARGHLIPSLAMPSDHMPVVVDLKLRGLAAARQRRAILVGAALAIAVGVAYRVLNNK